MVVQAGWTTNLPGVEVAQFINAANEWLYGLERGCNCTIVKDLGFLKRINDHRVFHVTFIFDQLSRMIM
jgi:hypothetical protein